MNKSIQFFSTDNFKFMGIFYINLVYFLASSDLFHKAYLLLSQYMASDSDRSYKDKECWSGMVLATIPIFSICF